MLPRAFTHMKAGASAVEITNRSWHVERTGKIPSGNSEMLLCCPERPEQQKERKCHFVALCITTPMSVLTFSLDLAVKTQGPCHPLPGEHPWVWQDYWHHLAISSDLFLSLSWRSYKRRLSVKEENKWQKGQRWKCMFSAIFIKLIT